MRSNSRRAAMPFALRILTLALAAVACCAAHNGPPFPIIVDRPMSGCVISLWTHPDVGIGTFFVIVNRQAGHPLPSGLKFEIGVQPLSGRLKEARYPTERGDHNDEVRFNAAIPFDRQEMWRITLYTSSSAGSEEASANVKVTPPGLGRWDLLFFSSPFLGVGFLWFLGMKKTRLRRPAERAANH